VDKRTFDTILLGVTESLTVADKGEGVEKCLKLF